MTRVQPPLPHSCQMHVFNLQLHVNCHYNLEYWLIYLFLEVFYQHFTKLLFACMHFITLSSLIILFLSYCTWCSLIDWEMACWRYRAKLQLWRPEQDPELHSSRFWADQSSPRVIFFVRCSSCQWIFPWRWLPSTKISPVAILVLMQSCRCLFFWVPERENGETGINRPANLNKLKLLSRERKNLNFTSTNFESWKNACFIAKWFYAFYCPWLLFFWRSNQVFCWFQEPTRLRICFTWIIEENVPFVCKLDLNCVLFC